MLYFSYCWANFLITWFKLSLGQLASQFVPQIISIILYCAIAPKFLFGISLKYLSSLLLIFLSSNLALICIFDPWAHIIYNICMLYLCYIFNLWSIVLFKSTKNIYVLSLCFIKTLFQFYYMSHRSCYFWAILLLSWKYYQY